MGCTSSSLNSSVDEDDIAHLAEYLGMDQNEIRQLRRTFDKMEVDKDGTVQIQEMLHFYSSESSSLNSKIFSLFDRDNSNDINFEEFVCFSWNLLTLPIAGKYLTVYFIEVQFDNLIIGLGVIAYLMGDPSGSGWIDKAITTEIIESIHKKKVADNSTISPIFTRTFAIGFKGSFSFDEFLDWTIANPALVAPLAQLQYAMATKLIGTAFWDVLKSRRNSDEIRSSAYYICTIQKKMQSRKKLAAQQKQIEANRDQINKHRGLHKRQDSMLLRTFGLSNKKSDLPKKGLHQGKETTSSDSKKKPMSGTRKVIPVNNSKKVSGSRSDGGDFGGFSSLGDVADSDADDHGDTKSDIPHEPTSTHRSGRSKKNAGGGGRASKYADESASAHAPPRRKPATHS